MTLQRNAVAGQPGETWVDDDELLAGAWSSSYPPENLVTFRYIWAAVRRHAKVWIAAALAGLAMGLVVPALLPPVSESSVKLLLTHRDGDDPMRAAATDLSLIETNTVAQRVIDKLGLSATPEEILGQYDATTMTDRIMEIVARAPSSGQATALAAAVADVYLPFRAEQFAAQGELLRDDLSDARAAVKQARADLVAAGEDPGDPDPPSTPEWTTFTRAAEAERFIEQQILDHEAAATRMNTSRVLDTAAPVPRSTLKDQLISTSTGLVAGLSLGVGFVVIRALLSERLWSRKDIARALGAPVRLSVKRSLNWRWRMFPHRLGRSPLREPALWLVVRHLRGVVLGDASTKPALAIVSVDNARPSALVVAALAMDLAEKGKRVLVGDLSGAVLAKALGITDTGTHEVRIGPAGASVSIHVPAADDVPPAEHRLQAIEHAAEDYSLDAAWTAADVVLTLATVSPALGAEHLCPWSSAAVAVITAGRSSSTKLHATGETIRLAGVRLESAVLLRADKTDDSLGIVEDDSVRPRRAVDSAGP